LPLLPLCAYPNVCSVGQRLCAHSLWPTEQTFG